MADTDIVQVIAEARIDARSLSEFVFKPAGFKVARRLAPTVDTLQFYINRFNSLNGEFSSSVSAALSSLNNSVAEADGKVAYIETTVQDAINNTAVEGGVLADTFVTATANGVGTIARTQRDKNSDVISIKDFGAKGDGLTDDSDAFIAAFTSMTNGGVLEVSNASGFYRLGKVLPPMPENLTLRGDGKTWIKNDRNTVFNSGIQPSSGCTVEYICFDGNTFPDTGGMEGSFVGKKFGIRSSSRQSDGSYLPIRNVNIRNNRIKNCFVGIRMDGLQDSTIRDNTVEYCENSGMLGLAWTTAPIKNLKILNNFVQFTGDTSCAFVPDNVGELNGVVSDVKISGNYFKNTQYKTGGFAIDFETKGDIRGVLNIEISNNTIMQETSPLGNHDQGGITAQGVGITIKNNIVKSLHGLGSTAGISVWKLDSEDVVISDNVVEGFLYTGIRVGGGTKNVDVYNNSVINCGKDSWVYPAISIIGSVGSNESITIRDNRIINTVETLGAVAIALGRTGVSSETNTDISIIGNTIKHKNSTAIHIFNSNCINLFISSNVVLSKSKGMTVSNCTNTIIEKNLFADLANSGFVLFKNNTGLIIKENDFLTSDTSTFYSVYDFTGSTGISLLNNHSNIRGTRVYEPAETFSVLGNKVSGNVGSYTNFSSGITTDVISGASIPTGLKSSTITSFNITPLTAGVTDLSVSVVNSSLILSFAGTSPAQFSWTASNAVY